MKYVVAHVGGYRILELDQQGMYRTFAEAQGYDDARKIASALNAAEENKR